MDYHPLYKIYTIAVFVILLIWTGFCLGLRIEGGMLVAIAALITGVVIVFEELPV